MGKFMPAISERLALGWFFLGVEGAAKKNVTSSNKETNFTRWVILFHGKILQTFCASNHRFRIVLEGQQACQCRCQACMPLAIRFGTGGVVWPSRGRLVKFLPGKFQISGTAIGVFLWKRTWAPHHFLWPGFGAVPVASKFSRRSWNLWPWLACSFEGAVALLPSSFLAGSSRLMLSDSLPDYWIGYQEPQ